MAAAPSPAATSGFALKSSKSLDPEIPRTPRHGTSAIRARHDAVWLRYSINGRPFIDMVAVVSLPCHFGGTRPLFRCNGCQRLARVRYLHPTRFVCQRCTGLRYWSRSVSSRTRTQMAIHRVQKADARRGCGFLAHA